MPYKDKEQQRRYEFNWRRLREGYTWRPSERLRSLKRKNILNSDGRKTTWVDYEVLKANQNNKCAICGTDESLLKKRLSVDHDHRTGKIRGLLCSNCNRGIGLLKDDIEIVKKSLIYLSKNL